MTNGCHRGKSFLNGKHSFSDTGTGSIESHDRITCRIPLEIERLDEKDLLPLVGFMLLGGNDVADDFGNNHGINTSSTIATIVASVGTSLGLNANAASRPRHTYTVSPAPAPTASIATTVPPP